METRPHTHTRPLTLTMRAYLSAALCSLEATPARGTAPPPAAFSAS